MAALKDALATLATVPPKTFARERDTLAAPAPRRRRHHDSEAPLGYPAPFRSCHSWISSELENVTIRAAVCL